MFESLGLFKKPKTSRLSGELDQLSKLYLNPLSSKKIKKAVDLGNSLGLEVHAGHGLTYQSSIILSKTVSSAFSRSFLNRLGYNSVSLFSIWLLTIFRVYHSFSLLSSFFFLPNFSAIFLLLSRCSTASAIAIQFSCSIKYPVLSEIITSLCQS